MEQLGPADLCAALEFAREALAATDLQAFRHDLVPGLRRLVACDRLGYNEIDLERGTAFVVSDPPGVEFPRSVDRHLTVEHRRSGDVGAYIFSPRELHRLGFHNDGYRPLEDEDQLALGLSGEAIVAITLSRGTPAFTERDRAMLETVRPHLALAYERARADERSRALIDALDAGLEARHAGLIQLDSQGRVVHATSAARELLDAHCGSAERLPAHVQAWLAQRSNGRRRELLVDGPRGQLRVREHGESGDWRALLLEERRVSPPAIDSLRALGLTERQAQVLRLLACGKPSRQIAAELQISTATVEKHLEHIYERLGVSTRAQALASVYA
jgi:DNA-binding CsgD family transcriptional regulator